MLLTKIKLLGNVLYVQVQHKNWSLINWSLAKISVTTPLRCQKCGNI